MGLVGRGEMEGVSYFEKQFLDVVNVCPLTGESKQLAI